MKSGLEGRNNESRGVLEYRPGPVSMKSSLEGRNNWISAFLAPWIESGLNEVRPRRPEQYEADQVAVKVVDAVSMKSGLEGRNNAAHQPLRHLRAAVSMKSGLEGRNNGHRAPRRGGEQGGLHEVRPRRPEQLGR